MSATFNLELRNVPPSCISFKIYPFAYYVCTSRKGSIDLILLALGSTQPLTEMSTSNLSGGKGRPARRPDNLTAVCESIVYTKCGSLDFSQPYGPSRLLLNSFKL
jgi:hypothetical protein